MNTYKQWEGGRRGKLLDLRKRKPVKDNKSYQVTSLNMSASEGKGSNFIPSFYIYIFFSFLKYVTKIKTQKKKNNSGLHQLQHDFVERHTFSKATNACSVGVSLTWLVFAALIKQACFLHWLYPVSVLIT